MTTAIIPIAEVAQNQGLRYYCYWGSIVEHTSIPAPPGFSNLSKAEQVRYLQALWDRITENPNELPVPETHLEIAEQRLAQYRRNPDRAGSAYDALDRLGKKTR